MGALRFTSVMILVTCLLGSGAARGDDARAGFDEEAARARASTRATRLAMESRALEVRELLRRTRKRGSRTQIACVDESLSRADVALRRARDVETAAASAWARNDRGRARLLTRRVAVLAFASRAARDTARGCAPEAPAKPAKKEGTVVTVVIDPG